MKIVSIQIGMPKIYDDPSNPGKEWRTAIFKEPVEGPVWTTTLGLRGDGQADKRVHGGPDLPLNVYSVEHYSHWTADLGLDAMPFGAFGENLTIRGALEGDVCIGDVYEVGDAVLQVSQPRQPCGTLARRWRTPDLPKRVEKTGMTGWYFRVLTEGELMAGDEFKRIERPHPEWTVSRANEIMHHRRTDYDAALQLSVIPPLSAFWKQAMARRAIEKSDA